MEDWFEVIITGSAYLGLAALGALVLAGLWWFTSVVRPPWLTLPRVRFVSWHGIDVFAAFAILLFVPILTDELLRHTGFFEWLYGVPGDVSIHERELLWSSALCVPFELGLIIVALRLLRGTHFAELGITTRRIGAKLVVGYLAWLMLTPTTLAVQSLAIQVTPPEWVQEHPLVLAGQQPLAVSEWVMIIATAVVFGPLVEEIVFRGILLPWQLQAGWEAQATIGFCVLFIAAMSGMRSDEQPYVLGPVLFVLAMLPGIFLVPFMRRPSKSIVGEPILVGANESAETSAEESEMREDKATPARSPEESQWRHSEAEVAIYTNGLFFAIMHATAWPSPIPLFLLGTGLAWVRYRTSSLVAPILLHAMFNGVAVMSLIMESWWKSTGFEW